jgi:ribosomal protein S2
MYLAGKKLKNKEILNNLISSVYKKKPFLIKGDILQSSDELLKLFKKFGEKNLAILFVTAEKPYEKGLRESALKMNQSYMGTKIIYGLLSNYFEFVKNLPKTNSNWISRGYNIAFRPFQPQKVKSFFDLCMYYKKNYANDLVWGYGRYKARKFNFLSTQQKEVWRRKFLYQSIYYKLNLKVKNIFQKLNMYLPFTSEFLNVFIKKFGFNGLQLLYLLNYKNNLIHSKDKVTKSLTKEEKKPSVIFVVGSSPKLIHFLSEGIQNGCLIISLTDDERIVKLSDFSVYVNKSMVGEVNILLNLLSKEYLKGLENNFLSTKNIDLHKKLYKQKLNKVWRLTTYYRSLVRGFNTKDKYVFHDVKGWYLRLFLHWLKSYGFMSHKKWGLDRFSYYRLNWVINSWYKNIIKYLGLRKGVKLSFFTILFRTLLKKNNFDFSYGKLAGTLWRKRQLAFDDYYAGSLHTMAISNRKIFFAATMHRRRIIKRRLRYFHINWDPVMYTTRYQDLITNDAPLKKPKYRSLLSLDKARNLPQILSNTLDKTKVVEKYKGKRTLMMNQIKFKRIPWWVSKKLITFGRRKKTPTKLNYKLNSNFSAKLVNPGFNFPPQLQAKFITPKSKGINYARLIK